MPYRYWAKQAPKFNVVFGYIRTHGYIHREDEARTILKRLSQ